MKYRSIIKKIGYILYSLLCFLQASQCTSIRYSVRDTQHTYEALSDRTPLLFQWYPKTFDGLILEEHQHRERLITWSEREPQRTIYLVVHGAGLSPDRMQVLTNMFQSKPTIQIVDFNTIDLKEKDFTVLIQGKEYKISQLLKYRYKQTLLEDNVAEDIQKKFLFFHKKISMGVWIDLMRIAMLRAVKDFTGSSEIIYMDFDFQIGAKGEHIGSIHLPRGIALADGNENNQSIVCYIENGAIAINTSSQAILIKMIDEIKKRFFSIDFNSTIDRGLIYGAMVKVIDRRILSEGSGLTEAALEQLEQEDFWASQDLTEQHKAAITIEETRYKIQHNGGNIRLKQDPNSWG